MQHRTNKLNRLSEMDEKKSFPDMSGRAGKFKQKVIRDLSVAEVYNNESVISYVY